jgi:RNA polymerase sigma-70 factor, ECF subfamily
MKGTNREITELLNAWHAGDRDVENQLMELVRANLREIAVRYLGKYNNRHMGLQPTEVINELYLRLVDQRHRQWEGRAHFFGLAARLVRNVLVDEVRKIKSQKRGGGAYEMTFDPDLQRDNRASQLLELDEALIELERLDARKYRIVELFQFGGFTQEEIAMELGVSVATVKRDWERAKDWIGVYLKDRKDSL